MIVTLNIALFRLLLFWYIVGLLMLFIGDPQWAEGLYARLSAYTGVPVLDMQGLGTAAQVQAHLLRYWTLPILGLCALAVALGWLVSAVYGWRHGRDRKTRLAPQGAFWGVKIPRFSLGALPLPTTPVLASSRVLFPESGLALTRKVFRVKLKGPALAAANLLSPAERHLCEELLQLLRAQPDHFAGHGHGVGLLEHTLNVMAEAATKCTPDFSLPLIAAAAHDIGKLITFMPDGDGGWKRKGLHSREGARILAGLPAFQALPELHRNALLLAVKYDHAPNKMPALRGQKDASLLAMRIISALALADRTATAAEKDRNLVKLQPEDLLWQDFVSFLRDAPVVQRGKKGAANQVNNPPDSPYLYIYEAPWRDAAIQRMPAEVAAALDLTRRDAGKMAKYTRILVERLRKEGLLVEAHESLTVSEANPLWDIQSGTGEKAVVLRGILVLKADALWKAVNYRMGVKSPFPVQILAPNASLDGQVNQAPSANKTLPPMPDISDGLKLADVNNSEVLASLGLNASPTGISDAPANEGVSSAPALAATKRRGRFAEQEPPSNESVFGLAPAIPEGSAPVTPLVSTGGASSTDSQPAEPPPSLSGPAPADESGAPPWADDPANQPKASVLDSPAQPDRIEAPRSPVEGTVPAAVEPLIVSPRRELSIAEKREGLAFADEAACQLYPKLTSGDKYYTHQSRMVHEGKKKPGDRYKGDDKDNKPVDPCAPGPKRSKRKFG